jgi:hypothetical protein
LQTLQINSGAVHYSAEPQIRTKSDWLEGCAIGFLPAWKVIRMDNLTQKIWTILKLIWEGGNIGTVKPCYNELT